MLCTPAEDVQKTFSSIDFSDEDHPQAVALLRKLIETADERTGIKIENPKTGDPIAAIFGLLCFAGSGVVILGKRRKA